MRVHDKGMELIWMKVALYVRESSDDTMKAPPIKEQIETGMQWAMENQHEVVIIYKDEGFSGGNWKRPDWNKSVNDAKRHLFMLIWVWNQDRLARDTEQFLWYYRNLREAKVMIYEHTAGSMINMESLGDRVKHQSLAQAAEIFRLVTSEKVKSKYESKKKAAEKKNETLKWGRPRKDIDVEKAIELRKQGKGWRTIGLELGVSYQKVRRVLQNRAI